MSIITVTKDNFDAEVLKSDKPVLVDFFAEWCGPCKTLGPILEEIATERADDLKVVKIDVDKDPEIAAEYGVRSMPTMAVFKEGTPVLGTVGALPKAEIEKFIDDAIQKDPAEAAKQMADAAEQMKEQQERIVNAIFDKALDLGLVGENDQDNKAEAIDAVFNSAMEAGTLTQEDAVQIGNPLEILEHIANAQNDNKPELENKMEDNNKKPKPGLKDIVEDVTTTFNAAKEQLKDPEVQEKLKKDAKNALETGKAVGKAATDAAKNKLKKFLGKRK